jgi:hypothetical protein
MKKVIIVVAFVLMGCLIPFGLHAIAQTKSPTSDHGVSFQVTPDIAAKANNPAPSDNTKQQSKQSTIGDGKVKVTTPKDNSFWTEEIDIDGSGNAVEAQMLWDDTNKILYMYADKPFKCVDGSTANGDFMIAMYGKGNPAKKNAGSGWWAANLDQGQCKAQNDELYGCKFDASGNNTMCGVANLNQNNNELTITTVTTTRNK